jgi:putative phosphoribosyl transferase
MLNQKIFNDRKHAGALLAEKIEVLDVPVILAVPRGGVETAVPIAEKMGAQICVIITKKIPHPQKEEFAIGAISEEGEMYIPEGNHFSIAIFEPILAKVNEEINRRIETYRNGKPLPDLENKTVILVDDGIATGATLIPAIRLCRKKGAAKIIVACPISGRDLNPALTEADEIIILEKQEPFFGVSQAYENFPQLNDEQVVSILNEHKIET